MLLFLGFGKTNFEVLFLYLIFNNFILSLNKTISRMLELVLGSENPEKPLTAINDLFTVKVFFFKIYTIPC